MANKWMLFALFLLGIVICENLIIVWIGIAIVPEFSTVDELMENSYLYNENYCFSEFCYDNEEYLYSYKTKKCSCFDNGILVKSEVIE